MSGNADSLCGCPQHPGRQIIDELRHARFHALVVEQGGPAGRVDAESLRQARGMAGAPVGVLPYRRPA